ncbi:CerR family C-terminal domain-containing protein [Caulobacter sp. S45]|jgi:AcrR family transcriptional regulator|uniref:CerR family C-terminal domain-containing protein n=1 Tax=Caulobacter sp. S45 TaxID=1641861 RepID=UPI00131D36A0|nr:CerR family C-terminal domain-containing protein [Caulobacter sp. S45]
MALSYVRRRPTAGGYARGEETRLRIIESAVELFGVQGFERTSTREIAALAGVNPPALQYYFDSKEGLYVACAEHITARAWSILEPAVRDVQRRLAGEIDLEGLIDCVCTIQACAAEFLLRSAEVRSWSLFIGREEGACGAGLAGQVLEKGMHNEIYATIADAIGRIIGKPADDPETRVRMVALNGQVSIFQASRDKALRALGWQDMDAEGVALIKRVARSQTEAALRAAASPAFGAKTK